MSPTAEIQYLLKEHPSPFEGDGVIYEKVLQVKWVAHHIPAGKTEVEFEWRDVETVKETK